MATPTTVSTSTAVVGEGKHVFEIVGYSHHRGIGAGGFVRSATFSVGGVNWSLRFYPDGFRAENRDYISVYLELMSGNAKPRASCDLRLVDQRTGAPSSVHRTEPRVFRPGRASRFAPATPRFMERSALGPYLQDDRLAIECVVSVFRAPQALARRRRRPGRARPRIHVPPPDSSEHLGRLLEEGDGADVTFSVGGRPFAAHRLVLAARSPVFRAELRGGTRKARRTQSPIIIDDMQPEVFEALLRFIYTDSLPPAMDDLDGGERSEMVRHLLVAADRYAMERLKVMCQSILCECLVAKNVEDTLALADRHHCHLLKNACIEFIKSSGMDGNAAVPKKGFLRNFASVLVGACAK